MMRLKYFISKKREQWTAELVNQTPRILNHLCNLPYRNYLNVWLYEPNKHAVYSGTSFLSSLVDLESVWVSTSWSNTAPIFFFNGLTPLNSSSARLLFSSTLFNAASRSPSLINDFSEFLEYNFLIVVPFLPQLCSLALCR